MTKMNPDVKQRWLAALRGGDYPQSSGALQDRKGYCCLGVLCDLYRKEVGGEWLPPHGTHDETYKFRPIGTYDRAVGMPQDVVLQWADLPLRGPSVYYNGEDTELVVLNDGNSEDIEPQSFSTIADLIERQL